MLNLLNQLINFLIKLTGNSKVALPKPVQLSFTKSEPSTGATNKPPIIIFHGIFSCKEHWTKLPKQLSEETKRVVYALDIRDHGQTAHTSEFTYKAMISDLINFLTVNKIESATFIGHSLGAMTIARLASLYPELVEKFVLIDIQPAKVYRQNGQPNTVQLLSRFLKKAIEIVRNENLDLESSKKRMNELLEEQVKDEKLRKGLLFNLILRDNQLEWKFNLKELNNFLDLMYKEGNVYSDNIKVNFNGDVLLIYGGQSEFFKKDEDIDDVLKVLPNTKFECIETGGHSLPFTHANEFLNKTVSFINS